MTIFLYLVSEQLLWHFWDLLLKT